MANLTYVCFVPAKELIGVVTWCLKIVLYKKKSVVYYFQIPLFGFFKDANKPIDDVIHPNKF